MASLVLIGKGQEIGIGAILDGYLAAEIPKGSVLEVASGFAKGYGTFALTVLLIAYNMGRWYLTKEVSLTKADYDRNDRSPRLAEYKKLFQIHRVVRLLMYVSLAMFISHAYSWLTTPVVVPRA